MSMQTHKRARLTLCESIVLFGTPLGAQRQGDVPSACPSGGPSVPATPTRSAGSIVTSCLELRSSSHPEACSSIDLHDALRPLLSESQPTVPESVPIPQALPLQACCTAPVWHDEYWQNLADSLTRLDTQSAWACLLQDTDAGLACGPAPDDSAARVDHSLATAEPARDYLSAPVPHDDYWQALMRSLTRPDTESAWAYLLQRTDPGLACGPVPSDKDAVTATLVQDADGLLQSDHVAHPSSRGDDIDTSSC